MPLTVAPIGRELKVVKISADSRTKRHLGSLGIAVSCPIRVLSNAGGSTICRVKDGRLALDRTMAARIFVS